MRDDQKQYCDQPLFKWQGTPNPRRCTNPAGWRTSHLGFGPCAVHGGNKPPMQAAWRKAMSIADALDVSPWDSLIDEVKLSTGRISWIDQRLVDAVAKDDENKILEAADPDKVSSMSAVPGLPPGVKELMVESRAERRHRATVAKAAIDAGVAERLVRNIENEGALIAAAILAGLDALNFLTIEQRSIAVAAAHAKLLSIEYDPPDPGNGRTIAGELG